MIANIFDNNLVRVISYMLISPGSKYRRKELKERTEMNNIPLDNTLSKLLSLKIIKEKNHLFSLDFENIEIQNIINNIRKEHLEFNVPYKIFNILTEITDKLIKERTIKKAILFGSYAKLIHTEKSDIDIAIILSDRLKDRKAAEERIKKEMRNIKEKKGKEIEVHFFLERDLKRHKKDTIIHDILNNGKPLF